ncbi:MAG TPA: DUF1918 domain-containing protein [Egibacteraceae bacterium]|nr:DUF971 domain-containing protein [Actinomycetota bacterium]HWB73259.1 DUF1918 domain-containing protein [Egibacteraceae bacterium]
MEVKAGDEIQVKSRQVGGQVRRGRVTAVINEQPLELQVVWDDGHESLLYPSGGVVKVTDRPVQQEPGTAQALGPSGRQEPTITE